MRDHRAALGCKGWHGSCSMDSQVRRVAAKTPGTQVQNKSRIQGMQDQPVHGDAVSAQIPPQASHRDDDAETSWGPWLFSGAFVAALGWFWWLLISAHGVAGE